MNIDNKIDNIKSGAAEEFTYEGLITFKEGNFKLDKKIISESEARKILKEKYDLLYPTKISDTDFPF